jgi:hypothetical protein
MPATTDRGDVIHFSGRHKLSPALRDGAPALVGHGDAAGRCGWAPFFRAMDERGLALAFDAEDGGSARFVPRAEARADPVGHGPGPLEEGRLFLAGLREHPSRSGAGASQG